MPHYLLALSGVVGITSILVTQYVDINTVMMRFFRDVARSKARKRLYGDNQHALMPMLLGQEELLDIHSMDDADAITMTREELQYYRGQEEGRPIYLSIEGRIYDVTQGSKFYGPDKHYHLFTGTDATRAFATGCTKLECVSSDTTGLTEKEHKEILRWLEMYETHDKYTFVGYLVDDPVDAILDQMDDEAQQQQPNAGAATEDGMSGDSNETDNHDGQGNETENEEAATPPPNTPDTEALRQAEMADMADSSDQQQGQEQEQQEQKEEETVQSQD
eukprot:CAMPEP_0198117500 /NCGR_PEP_ID=MMETSP1442-20131203/18316_1 /TAXON_ID= /ORGANISM="Craspedostauros australis, Strain CCMP3328" /LENGTH=275 /DNA_ID=CAMNT_0043775561 /DNA_START=111 /DNA_END=938 /DNA_ORIENTATION=-